MPGSNPVLLPEDDYLRSLGYQPELLRKMGSFGNFAVSFSVISVLSGCMTLFGFGLTAGGPTVMMLGWVAVGLAVLLVGMSLAEVTSAYPTSGALFYMSRQLGGPRWGWVTGWLNLLGLLGGIAGIDYGAAGFIAAFAGLQWGVVPTPGLILGVFAGVLLLHALLNVVGVRAVSVLNSVSVWWHLAGVALIVGVLAVVPARHQTMGWVIGHFENGTGWSSPLYASAIGLLLGGYTFCGFDASAHMSEETADARVAAPRGIVRSIWVSLLVGFVLLGGLLFAVQDYDGTVAAAVPPAQIFLDALGAGGAKTLLLVVIGAQLFCGSAETTAASRMIYSFSRDGALPGSATWRRVSANGTPVPAVWLAVTVAFVLAVPSLWSATAYGAVTAVNVIGMTPSYVVPVFLKLRYPHKFTPGPWNLGRWSRPVGIAAVVWVAVLTVLVCLPQRAPVTVDSFNYAPLTLLAVLAMAWVWWKLAGDKFDVPVVADAHLAKIEAQIV
ncbi:amino acid permease [Kitasatospora cineracea]|uniref:Amino acid/polyamine/organocation transporter (APC superfamily) n=1 Tax=Kitasatospora cineracea TaxID=88074 RepID=A0A8G1XE28_9ACTN|nr:amino acid/polyamine/organocation transporter (APC superfamily) [Kitasatospora cineracea]